LYKHNLKVHPHDQLAPAPNDILNGLWSVYNSTFLGSKESQSFISGGYFSRQINPKMRVINLNTQYFFDSNTASPGCDVAGPGKEQISWLSSELKDASQKKQAVYIMGHVSMYVQKCATLFCILICNLLTVVVPDI
jgi:hypothetical protein